MATHSEILLIALIRAFFCEVDSTKIEADFDFLVNLIQVSVFEAIISYLVVHHARLVNIEYCRLVDNEICKIERLEFTHVYSHGLCHRALLPRHQVLAGISSCEVVFLNSDPSRKFVENHPLRRNSLP